MLRIFSLVFVTGLVVFNTVYFLDARKEAQAALKIYEERKITVTELDPIVVIPEPELFHYPPAEDIYCMTKNIYFEAGNQTKEGMEAVAQVVLNRVESQSYPNTVCEVIYQAQLSRWHLENTGKEVPLRHKCQFSWYCDGKPDEMDYSSSTWIKAMDVAWHVLMGEHTNLVGSSTHYHANYVDPYWNKSLKRVATIDSHIFYQKK